MEWGQKMSPIFVCKYFFGVLYLSITYVLLWVFFFYILTNEYAFLHVYVSTPTIISY